MQRSAINRRALTGPLRLIHLLAPNMIARGYGRIVNLSSGWGSFAEGMGGPGMYGVTKAALNALTVRLAKELPSAVKVNAMYVSHLIPEQPLRCW